jgi:hypothetical protein
LARSEIGADQEIAVLIFPQHHQTDFIVSFHGLFQNYFGKYFFLCKQISVPRNPINQTHSNTNTTLPPIV